MNKGIGKDVRDSEENKQDILNISPSPVALMTNLVYSRHTNTKAMQTMFTHSTPLGESHPRRRHCFHTTRPRMAEKMPRKSVIR